MKLTPFIKPLVVLIPLSLAACDQQKPPPQASVCNAGGPNAFKVTVSVENDGMGNPVVKFTNYTLDVGLDGNPVDPLIFVCVEGQATFENVPLSKRVMFPKNPNGLFSPSGAPNPNAHKIYIIHNKNDSEGTYRYSITVNTTDFGTMTIDPRIRDGGGGTIS